MGKSGQNLDWFYWDLQMGWMWCLRDKSSIEDVIGVWGALGEVYKFGSLQHTEVCMYVYVLPQRYLNLWSCAKSTMK